MSDRKELRYTGQPFNGIVHGVSWLSKFFSVAAPAFAAVFSLAFLMGSIGPCDAASASVPPVLVHQNGPCDCEADCTTDQAHLNPSDPAYGYVGTVSVEEVSEVDGVCYDGDVCTTTASQCSMNYKLTVTVTAKGAGDPDPDHFRHRGTTVPMTPIGTPPTSWTGTDSNNRNVVGDCGDTADIPVIVEEAGNGNLCENVVSFECANCTGEE